MEYCLRHNLLETLKNYFSFSKTLKRNKKFAPTFLMDQVEMEVCCGYLILAFVLDFFEFMCILYVCRAAFGAIYDLFIYLLVDRLC